MAASLAPRKLARIGGALYLIIIVIGLLGEVGVRGRVVVSGNAIATAANLGAMESLWRIGIAGEILLLLCATALTVIFYVLLRPVSRGLALAATIFNVVSIAIEAVSALRLIETLFPLGHAPYLAAFTPEQRDALAYLAIRAHGFGFAVALIFFGCVCPLLGTLIYRSGFLPRAVGVLMMIAGASYLIDGFVLILSPSLADALFPWILLPSLVGESSFCLWLLLKGVDEAKWRLAESS
jgi:hypothetical protein